MPTEIFQSFFVCWILLFFMAAGQSLVMTGGGLDFSGPGVVVSATAAGVWAYGAAAASVPVAIAAMGMTGLLFGVLQGVAVARLGLRPWLVTVLGLAVGSGFGGSSNGQAAIPIPADLAAAGSSIGAWGAFAFLAGLILYFTSRWMVFGRWLRALGHDAETARLAGVPATSLTVATYAVSAASAAVAALFLAGRPAPACWPSSPVLLADVFGAAVLARAFAPASSPNPAALAGAAAALVAISVAFQAAGMPPGAAAMAKALGVLVVTRGRLAPAAG